MFNSGSKKFRSALALLLSALFTMSDSLGTVTVPDVAPSGTLPLRVLYPVAKQIAPQIVTHRFGAGNAKREQRFFLGNGARCWSVNAEVTVPELATLRDFWEARQGSYQPFTFNAPKEDGTTEAVTAQFDETAALTWDWISQTKATVSLALIEVNTGSGPAYTLASTATRFPSSALADALLDQAQTIIPLVHIKVRKAGYPDNIFLSDRRCTVGGQLYQARLLRWEGIGQTAVGAPGAGSESDNVTLVFGNADRVMRDLAYSVRLDQAAVEFSLFHVGTGIKLDLWAGEILANGWRNPPGSEFTINCSDPVSSPFVVLPDRIIDRKCDAPYNLSPECPFSSVGALDSVDYPSADASFCDRGYDTANGCLAHDMKLYYRGILATPQAVRFADNSSGGLFKIGRSLITSVSLIADSVYGMALPAIYTDIPMPVQALIAMGRDNGDFYDAIGIVGEGPLTVIQSATLDGQYDASYPRSLGRLILGTRPADPDQPFSLSYDGDQRAGDPRKIYLGNSTYLDNYTAGLAFVGIRRTDQPGLQLSQLSDHDMEVIVSAGLKGWAWSDPSDPTSRYIWAPLVNAVWVAINQYLIAKGLQDESATVQAAAFDLPRVYAAAAICDLRVDRIVDYTAASNGTLVSVSPDNAGSGYTLGDVIAVGGGAGTAIVSGVDLSGRVVSLNVNGSASGYVSGLGVPAWGGTGSGLTLVVTATEINDGKETQFKFIGKLADIRPLRDWLSDILENCLGIWWFNFGKLSIAIRENSSAVAAFGSGSMLFKSLAVAAAGTDFDRLTYTFADPLQDPATGQNQFVPNTATFQDDDFALELGSNGRAVYTNGQKNLVGTANISQAQRLANTRGREEVGGVNEAERNAAVKASWGTTIMALDVGPGDVVSVTDPEMPGGSGELRILNWQLNPDYSITLTGRTTTDSMYDLVAGPKPADVMLKPVPPELFPYPLQPAWNPNEETPISGDPLYATDDNSFACAQQYTPLTDGSQRAALIVRGKLPINNFIANAQPPQVSTITQSATGGSLAGGTAYFLAVCARDSSGEFTPPSNILKISVAAATNTNQITLSDIAWPAGTYAGYALFASDNEQTMCMQVEFTGALPSAVVLSAPKRSTYNMPSPVYRNIRVKAKPRPRGGVIGFFASAVATGTIAGVVPGGGDHWTGRILSLIAHASDGSAPLRNFTVTAYDDSTGTFTVTPDPLAAGVGVGDVLMVRYKPDTFTGLTIGDSGIINGSHPSGNPVDGDVGYILRGITPGKPHQLRKIVSNTATVYTLDRPLDFEPAYWVVEAAAWSYMTESTPTPALRNDLSFEVELISDNLNGVPVVIGCFMVDRNMDECPEELAPIRELFQLGKIGATSITVDGYFALSIVSNHVAVELTNARNQKLVLNQAARVTVDNPTSGGGAPTAGNDWVYLYVFQDATGGRPTPAWGTAFGSDVTGQVLDPTPNTRSLYQLTYHDDGLWHLDYFRTGDPVT